MLRIRHRRRLRRQQRRQRRRNTMPRPRRPLIRGHYTPRNLPVTLVGRPRALRLILVLVRLSQGVWITTPRDTVNQELKLYQLRTLY